MTQAIKGQGLVMAIKGWLTDAHYDVTTPPNHSILAGKGGHVVGQKLRLSISGHLLLAGVILMFAFSVVMVSRQAAQSRQRNLGYCDRVPIRLLSTAQEKQIKKNKPLALVNSSHLKELVLSIPTATPLQRQRLIQQAVELEELYHYHCQSMQIFSANYQALVSMANFMAMISAIMLVLLSLHGIQTEIRWPLSVLVASAFALGMAVVTIGTFHLKSNQQTSVILYRQTIALTRSFATAIGNQEYRNGSTLLSLRDRYGLAAFLNFIDKQLSLNDIPVFDMDDQFALKEATALMHKGSTFDSTH
jgi:hypothetical protein